jgi:hypothetical protein
LELKKDISKIRGGLFFFYFSKKNKNAPQAKLGAMLAVWRSVEMRKK